MTIMMTSSIHSCSKTATAAICITSILVNISEQEPSSQSIRQKYRTGDGTVIANARVLTTDRYLWSFSAATIINSCVATAFIDHGRNSI